MSDLRPTTLVITLAEREQDSRDLYSERALVCACCGVRNPDVGMWLLPGLCALCGMRVESVTVTARAATQPLFSKGGYPD
jgi:hypothetical protein